jgi:hypothetical protein
MGSAEYGWHAMNVVDGHPPWTFTIGLSETWNHPELIIIGRSRATAHEMLDAIVVEIDDGRAPNLEDAGTYHHNLAAHPRVGRRIEGELRELITTGSRTKASIPRNGKLSS